ncbi:MAG: hypothetical protein K6B72_11095 [Lachnospiraceae bacterium]|jgi:hypothetical protein|nr:hypothetical protein [Lachnospiraceae bacterium]
MFQKILEKIKDLFRQDEVYKMNKADAEKTLAHVFEATGKKPSQEPLEKLAARKTQPTQPYRNGVIFGLCALVLLLIMPLFFLPHRIPVRAQSDSARNLSMNNSFRDNDLLYLELSFGNPDLSASYIRTTDGVTLQPLGFNASRNELVLPCPEPLEDAEVYIYNTEGELLHLLLSPVS